MIDNNTGMERIADILRKLSISQEILRDEAEMDHIVRELKVIYSSGPIVNGEKEKFRHQYSKICGVIHECAVQDRESVNILGQNIDMLYQHVCDHEKDDRDFCQLVFKLKDHVNLEVGRINAIYGILDQLGGRTRNALDQIDDLQREERTLQNDMRKTKNKIKKWQVESITILGIFSAIVMAFVGGFSFSSSIITGIDQTSIYRLLLIGSLLGLLMVNLIYILTRLILRVRDDFFAIHYFSKHIIAINLFFIVVMVLVFLGWLIDIDFLAEQLQSAIRGLFE